MRSGDHLKTEASRPRLHPCVDDCWMPGAEGRPRAGSLRLQAIQADLWERWISDAAEDGLEGGRGSWLWGSRHKEPCQQVRTHDTVSFCLWHVCQILSKYEGRSKSSRPDLVLFRIKLKYYLLLILARLRTLHAQYDFLITPRNVH